MGRDNRRRLRNYLLRPRLQFRYALAIFFLISIGTGLIQLLSYLSTRRLIGLILNEAGTRPATLDPIIGFALRAELLRMVWLLPIFGIVALVFSAVFLHRFIGPLVPINRHIRKLTEGDYGARLQLRAGDELVEVAGGLNELSQTLKARHGSVSQQAPQKAGTDGFSLIDLLVVVAIIGVIAAMAVPRLQNALDSARQRSTMADMRGIAQANEMVKLDTRSYASALSDLVTRGYMQEIPDTDGWGNAWKYKLKKKKKKKKKEEKASYELTSEGSDKKKGPKPPVPWINEPHTPDLILEDGAFTQAPGSK